MPILPDPRNTPLTQAIIQQPIISLVLSGQPAARPWVVLIVPPGPLKHRTGALPREMSISGDQRDGVHTFQDQGDGTVLDEITGLVWQKCSKGQNNDSSCSGSPDTLSWDTAVDYCENLTLAGKAWRMPNVNELKSILDRTSASEAIDLSVFPGTSVGSSSSCWSSTAKINTPVNKWHVSFYNGLVDIDSYSLTSYNARCVSSDR